MQDPLSPPSARASSTASVTALRAAPRSQNPTNDIDLLKVLAILWRGKWTILTSALVAMLMGGYYAFFVADRQYASTARLVLEARDQNVVDIESVISGASTEQAAINTEIEVIRSRALLEKLVLQLDLHKDPEFNIELRPVGRFSPNRLSLYLAELAGNGPPDEPDYGPAALNRTVNRLLARVLSVSSKPKTYTFDIRATTNDPLKSAALANTLAEIYITDQIEVKFNATEDAVNWLSDRVLSLEEELQQKEGAIKDLRTETSLISQEALESINIQAKSMRERLTEARADGEKAQADLATKIAARDSGDVPAQKAAFADPAMQRLFNQAAGGDSNATRLLRERMELLIERERANVDRLTSQVAGLEVSLDRLLSDIEEQAADLSLLQQLERETEATRVLYESFLARLKETTVQVGLQRSDSRVLSFATPGNVVAPRKSLILVMTLILGGMVGTAYVVGRHLSQRGFISASELEQASGVPVVGQIPRMPIRRRSGLVDYISSKPTSAAAEAVRNLRTSVVMSNPDKTPKVILITSSIPGEGKTTQSIALAHNLAGLGKRVLLIEGDIRRRTFSQYFNANPAGGLASVVAGDNDFNDVMVHVPKLGIDVLMGDNVKINAADLFASERFEQFMRAVREAYDIVLIDTPPVLVVSDARVIARLSDAILYTVRWQSTNKQMVLDGIREFTSLDIPVSGLTLSQIDTSRLAQYGYGGYGAYAKYGKSYYDL